MLKITNRHVNFPQIVPILAAEVFHFLRYLIISAIFPQINVRHELLRIQYNCLAYSRFEHTLSKTFQNGTAVIENKTATVTDEVVIEEAAVVKKKEHETEVSFTRIFSYEKTLSYDFIDKQTNNEWRRAERGRGHGLLTHSFQEEVPQARQD